MAYSISNSRPSGQRTGRAANRRRPGKTRKRKNAPGVVFQPAVYRGMQRGINLLVEAVRPTLGPLPRAVAIEHTHGSNKMPELLDSGGVIARRILALPDRDADVGAMFLRHVLWHVHKEVGDGTATTAVLFQSVYNQGVRYLVSGGNAMQLRRYLEESMQLILSELSRMAVTLEGKERLAQMAKSICYDPSLSVCLLSRSLVAAEELYQRLNR